MPFADPRSFSGRIPQAKALTAMRCRAAKRFTENIKNANSLIFGDEIDRHRREQADDHHRFGDQNPPAASSQPFAVARSTSGPKIHFNEAGR